MLRKIALISLPALALAIANPVLAESADADGATMNYGTWGFDLSTLDTAIDPGDDFFTYSNRKWIAANPIPADRNTYGAFHLLDDQSKKDVEALIKDLVATNPAPGSTERRIVDAYSAYMDVDAIEAAGMAPAQPYLQTIYQAKNLEELVRLFPKAGYPGLIAAGVGLDSRNPTEYAVSVGFGGMGMPDRDYYLVDSEGNLAIREKYMAFLTAMLAAAGYTDPATAAVSVYAFERQVAELEWDRRMVRNPLLTYNELTRDELLALVPAFPTEALLEAGNFNDVERFLAPQILPTAEEVTQLGLTPEQLAMMGGGLPAMMKLVTETPLATVKAYMASRFVSGNASVLPSAVDNANFAFYGTAIGGAQEQLPRWKRAISAVEGQLGEQLSAVYVKRHFPPEAKARMDELVANLQRAMREGLQSNNWLAESSRAEGLAKLKLMNPMIGYPEKFETYDGLIISGSDPLANSIRATEWAIADNLAKLGKPVDNTEWEMLPQQVNAYFHPIFNQIVFPAGILQPPFFNFSADDAINYGAIGGVIGHEIGHGFDDNGSRYDSTGALRNWWQDEDRAAFDARTNELKKLIGQYCPVDDGALCLRADNSIGETIGDVVGLQMAYRAYKLSLDGKEAPVIDGMTGDQRFFLGWAQVWREQIRPERLRDRIMTANHPPGPFRVNNTVRQMDAWYKAFNVTPDDDLYLAPEDRVRIW